MVASYAAQFAGLDEVWLMPSPLNPLKAGAPPAPESIRLEMCRLVADGCSGVKVSDFEFALPRPSYTYRTLTCLREAFPGHEFFLIIGSDNWLTFDRWRNHREITEEFRIIIYPRPGYPVATPLPDSITLLAEAPQALISSTFVREGLAEGKNMNYFVPLRVVEYIKSHKLYDTK